MQVTINNLDLCKITLGEKDMQVRMDIARKYILAAFLNYNIKLLGPQLISVYLKNKY